MKMKTRNYRVQEALSAVEFKNTQEKRKSVLIMGLKIVLYSAVLVGILLITLMDAQQPILIDRFSEQSYTEYAQEFMTLMAILLLYGSARIFPKQAAVAYLFGGLLGMAYIREFDSWLDNNVGNGAWQVMAYSLAILTAYLVFRHRRHIWKRLASFINTRAFGIIITGILIVFIYSRLFSHREIWMSAMGVGNYMYVVTRASEEAIELLGYTLILIGAFEYFFILKSRQKIHENGWQQLIGKLEMFNERK